MFNFELEFIDHNHILVPLLTIPSVLVQISFTLVIIHFNRVEERIFPPSASDKIKLVHAAYTTKYPTTSVTEVMRARRE